MREIDQTLTATVTDLARGGAGIVKLPTGEIVFIPFTAPGDEVSFRITEKNKNYSLGELVQILRPSEIRINPPCAVFGRCGGCSWQHLPYSLQIETKTNGVTHALKRAGVPIPENIKIQPFPAEKIYSYRNRVQLRGDSASKKFGFYEKGSNRIVDIERCEISDPAINSAIPNIKDQSFREFKTSKVELTVNSQGEVTSYWNQKHAAPGFSQVHTDQNLILKNWVQKNIPSANILFDLYGGSGNLSESLQKNFSEIHCVDLSSPKDKPSRFDSNFHFHRSSVSEWIKKLEITKFKNRSTSVILDPPREGLSSDFGAIADVLFQLELSGVVLVGCDPDAFARDVYRFTKRGLKIEKLAVIDLFPQTPHIESLALLLP